MLQPKSITGTLLKGVSKCTVMRQPIALKRADSDQHSLGEIAVYLALQECCEKHVGKSFKPLPVLLLRKMPGT